jgi:hypothetical protein
MESIYGRGNTLFEISFESRLYLSKYYSESFTILEGTESTVHRIVSAI